MRGRAHAPDWLELFRLTRTDWRVSDSRLDPSDPQRLLGYIERLGPKRYEVLWLAEPVGWGYVTSLKLATAAFADISQFGGVVEPRRLRNRDAKGEPLLHRIRRRSPIMYKTERLLD
jgi:hypothetical protein